MSDQKKGPVVVGGIDVKDDPIVGKYSGGVKERMAKRRAEKEPLGNLAAADAAYKPGRDGAMPIGAILESQKRAGSMPDGENRSGLSQQTISGMEAIAKASAAARAQKPAAPTPPAPPQPQPKEKQMEEMEAQPEPRKRDKEQPAPTKQQKDVADALEVMDDFEIERIMRGIQNDVINNTKERDHVNDPANKRLSEIDFAQGVAEGEFTQIVDVIPGRLKVHYRTLSPMEMQAIRLWIFDQVTKDQRLDKISGEMYGIGMLVASVVQIGGTKYPDHLKRKGQGTYSAEFDDKVFGEKYDMFSRMPQQLIHAVGTHGQWFDLRVRQMFTTDYAKNG